METKKYWNDLLGKTDYGKVSMPESSNWILNCALRFFGDVNGKTVLDLGFGNGQAALFFAMRGGNVIAVDSSEVAVLQLSKFCSANNIDNIRVINRSALDIRDIGPIDFVYGSMVLHHIEPFDKFADILFCVLDKNGKAFFWENSANSNLLMWFRTHMVGRLWVPKCGIDEEFPLTLNEINELKRFFLVRQEIPYMHFFRLVSSYLFRGHLKKPLIFLDNLIFKLKFLRRISYRQQLFLTKRVSDVSAADDCCGCLLDNPRFY